MAELLDIALDPETGLVVWDGQNLGVVRGRAAMAQRIRLALGLFFGEWFLDQSKGMRWREDVLIKNPNLAVIESVLKQYLYTLEGVAAVLELEATLSTTVARKLVVSFLVSTDEGDIAATLEGFPGALFVLSFDIDPPGFWG